MICEKKKKDGTPEMLRLAATPEMFKHHYTKTVSSGERKLKSCQEQNSTGRKSPEGDTKGTHNQRLQES
jgi:hypothetical protein